VITESFEYHVPKTLAEASEMVAQFGDEGKILAGGHSLIPLMRLRLAAPRHLIDIGRLAELKHLREEGDKVVLGALTTHHQIEASDLLKHKCPLMPETAGKIGDVQVRNKGTLGGSLAHSDPAADWPAAILALDAEMQAVSSQGERWIPAQDFFVDLLATALTPNEILTAIRVPVLPTHAGEAYAKLAQPASGFAVVGVAARVTLDEKGKVQQASVGVTGVGPKVYRASGVEAALRGESPTEKRLAEAAARAAEGVEPNADLIASGEYRHHLAAVYTRRALEKALERARGSST
jgi:aerobic carbon-monoxide dehydrogenase medium subunit